MAGGTPGIGTVPSSLPPGQINFKRMRKRWWAFRPFDLLARYWPSFGRRKGLLVVRIDGIGDLLMFLPALEHYSRVFGVPKDEITILGSHNWKSLAHSFLADYRVKTFDEGRFDKNPLYRLKIGLWVRRQRFQKVSCDLFFRKAMVADTLVWMAAAPDVYMTQPWISRKTQSEHAYYLGRHRYIETGAYPTHEIVRHYAYLSAIEGKPLPPAPPRLPWPRGRSVVPAGRPYIVVHFGCNEPGRRWPFANFQRLIGDLLDQGHRVVLTGSPKEADELKACPDLLARDNLINLVCRTTLDQAIDVIADAQAMVVNDTGPGHIAIALGVPTVMMQGGGHFGNFVPYPPEVCPPRARFVYQPCDCYHCFYNCTRRKVDRTPFPCYVEIPYERVWNEVRDLLREER